MHRSSMQDPFLYSKLQNHFTPTNDGMINIEVKVEKGYIIHKVCSTVFVIFLRFHDIFSSYIILSQYMRMILTYFWHIFEKKPSRYTS